MYLHRSRGSGDQLPNPFRATGGPAVTPVGDPGKALLLALPGDDVVERLVRAGLLAEPRVLSGLHEDDGPGEVHRHDGAGLVDRREPVAKVIRVERVRGTDPGQGEPCTLLPALDDAVRPLPQQDVPPVVDYADEVHRLDIDLLDSAVSELVGSYVGALQIPGVEHSAARFFRWLGPLIESQSPACRRLRPDEEERLDRICIVLALYEEVYRVGVWPTSPLASVPPDADVADLLALAPEAWVDDVAAVCARLTETVSFPSPRALNPTFALSRAVGGADADLVLDRSLVDIKTTIHPRLALQWLRQVLGYVLLDTDDRYHLDSVGLLLSRQAVLAEWPLQRLLDTAAGRGRPSLGAIRADFARVVESAHGPSAEPATASSSPASRSPS